VQSSGDVFIPKPQNKPTQSFDLLLSNIVVQLNIVLIMDPAVQFDDEPYGLTGEIREIATDRMLSAKLQPVQPAATQRLPKHLLRLGPPLERA
jgi:hypothetical protein